jgi:hypothetical protein
VDTYSGPEYTIHYRYSSIMNMVFVCTMFGTALPILYPIALLAMIIQYIVERCCVCYFYKQPPTLDEKLTINAINILTVAPIIYMAFSYWFLSNN